MENYTRSYQVSESLAACGDQLIRHGHKMCLPSIQDIFHPTIPPTQSEYLRGISLQGAGHTIRGLGRTLTHLHNPNLSLGVGGAFDGNLETASGIGLLVLSLPLLPVSLACDYIEKHLK